MTKIIQRAIFLLSSLLSLSTLAYGQDAPAVTATPAYHGFSLPDTAGTLSFAATGSESARTGYYGTGAIYSTSLSGDVAYLSAGTRAPFSAVYSGGYSTSSSDEQPSAFYQNLALSQVLHTRGWTFLVGDSVRYLPESASTGGLSGIPGQGDIGVPPIDPGDDILTNFGERVSNTVNGSAQHPITGSTSAQASGSYSIERFLDGFGLETNSVYGGGGLNHRINGLSSASLNYTYSLTSYPDQQTSFTTQGLNLGYTRQLNPRLSMSISAGPQLTKSSNAGSTANLNFSGSAQLLYAGRSSSAGIAYNRGVQAGSGVVEGALTSSVHASYSRTVGRTVSVSANLGYADSSSLEGITPLPFNSKTVSASLQASRSLTRTLSGFVSYSAETQSIEGVAATSIGFTGLSNVFSIGLSYSPRPIRVGHQ